MPEPSEQRQEAEAEMTRFARERLALNARVVGVEFNADHGIWVGTVIGVEGAPLVVARPRPDGTMLVSRYLGALPAERKRRPQR